MSKNDEQPVTITRRHLVIAAGTIGAGAFTAPGRAFGQDATPHGMDHGATPEASPVATPAPTPFNGITGEPLREVPVRASENGVLETTFTAGLGPATVAGQDVTAMVYEGEFPGPTLRLRAGDTLRLKLVNNLDDSTNIHTHGFHVSPKDNSDNIFVEVPAGTEFDYEFQLPDNHAPGTFWYHPHWHGNTAVQVNGGLAGVIIVEGAIDELDGIAGLTERTLVLSATQFNGDGEIIPFNNQTPTSVQRFVNGQLEPTIAIQPGETQRWRIANVSSDTFFLISLEGHALHEIANDGNPYDHVYAENQILLAPAERTEVLVQATTNPGSYALRTLQWGPDYQAQPDALLATMVVDGDPVETPPLPPKLLEFENLAGIPVDVTRVTAFQEPGPPLYLAIDGKHFDMNRVDQTVKLGALEEWVIRNESSHWHPFHIHVNDFQVIAFDGAPVRSRGYQDTVALPPDSEITIRLRFDDYDGKFVYHCHILSHEDFGMMAVVEVVP